MVAVAAAQSYIQKVGRTRANPGKFAMATKGNDNVVACLACAGTGFDIDPSASGERAQCRVCGGTGIVKNTGTPLSIYDNPEYWCEIAKRIRALSVGEPLEHQKRLLDLALLYDGIGRRAANRSKTATPGN